MRTCAILICLVLLAGAWAQDPDIRVAPQEHKDAAGNSFLHYRLVSGKDQAYGPAVASAADVDGDGRMDFFVSHYGPLSGDGQPSPGKVVLYRGTGNLGVWNTQVVVPTSEDFTFPQGLAFADIDKDGDLDFVLPGGFLIKQNSGNIHWYEQLPGCTFRKHEIVTGVEQFFHEAILFDLNGDGILDIVTGAETAETMMWGKDSAQVWFFQGTADANRFEKTPKVLHEKAGSTFLELVDVDKDGDRDIVTSQFFLSDASFVWIENPGYVHGAWTRHIICDTLGQGFGIEFDSAIWKDGGFVATNHTNVTDHKEHPASVVVSFQIPSNPRQKWEHKVLSQGIVSRSGKVWGMEVAKQAAPGSFKAGDIDGDGRKDIVVSGDGDSRIFWYRNQGQGFSQIVLAGQNTGNPVTNPSEYGQAGVLAADLDGDGRCEIIVNAWEGNNINIFDWNSR